MVLSLFVLFAYLSGSIPFGYLISRLKGVDIRKVGSGNIGGTNVARKFGIKWGALVAVLDIVKGLIPSLLALHFLTNPWEMIIVLAAPVVGHIFSIWLKFKGGKGMACLFGVICPLLIWYQVIAVIIIWVVALKVSKIMSLVNIILVLFLPIILWMLYRHPAYVVFGVGIDILIWYAHRSNIKRLMKGEELKLSI